MPVISVNLKELLRLCNSEEDELKDILPGLGVEVDKTGEEEWELEVNPDRCDLLSVEGIGRAVRGLICKETGLPNYHVEPTDIITNVEMSVQEVRPFVVTAVIDNIELTEETLRSLMDVQEKLHLTLGRKRRKIAIGVHDLDMVKPPFTYKAVKPEKVSFVPLQKTYEMNLKDILEKHEKGKEYAHILEDSTHYPLIVDSEDNVLSFPPIINGVLTQVNTETKRLFIDMTGTNESSLINALNILCTMFAERGGSIKSTVVSYGGREHTYPDLSPGDIILEMEEIKDLLGIDIERETIIESLEKMRYSVESMDPKRIKVKYPAYRHDILHPWDVIEDLAISYGFHNFHGVMPKHVTFGKGRQDNDIKNTLAEVMIGMGFKEMMNYPLSSPEKEYDMLCIQRDDGYATIENPVSEDNTCLRTWIIPSLLYNLHNNRSKPHPHKFFEIGNVVNDLKQKTLMAGTISHSEAGFTGMKSVIEGISICLGHKYELKTMNHDSFIEGRCAAIFKDDFDVGYFGEIHPQVLKNFDLEYPVTAFEIDIRKLY